ncbi:aldehyde dehydrogenase family protein, partial [Mycobacterium tuberculosis]|nr:aldehyde dehydrogenase family protein [Mycobacterium tuberculosis]
ATLRAHPAVTGTGLHFTAEADSLNASILGTDVSEDDPEFDLYVKQLVTEMTVKAGQKCTAIRRALVPESLVDAVIGAASTRLGRVVVGDPHADGVTMGALASVE